MKKLSIISLFLLLAFSNLFSQTEYVGGTLKYGEEQFPEVLDPVSAINNMASLRISQLIYEPLVTIDEFGEPQPQLAESWKIVNNTIKFKLRENVKWHDGQYFGPNDVKFTLTTLKKPESRVAAYYRDLASRVDRIEIDINRRTVEITLRENVGDLLKFFSNIYIYPAHYYMSGILRNENRIMPLPNGTGPYQVRQNPTSNRILLIKNQSYYLNTNFDAIRCSITRDPEISVSELNYGGIDMKINVPNKDIGPLEATGKFKIYPYSSLRIKVIALNFNNNAIKNKLIRQAMVYGIDRDKLLNTFYYGYGQLISGPYAPSSIAYNPDVQPFPFNESKAKGLLEAAGCSDEDNDGILEYNDTELVFRLLAPIETNNATDIQVAEGIRDYLGRIGIRVEVIRHEWNTFLKEVTENKNFDMALFSLVFDENSNIQPLFYFKEDQKGSKNFINYENDIVNNLIDKSIETSDTETKRTIFYRLHEILAEDCPYIFLWTLNSNSVYHKKLRRVTIDPYKFFQNINQWYIDPYY